MRWRIETGPRRPVPKQRLLPFQERAERLDRRFKRAIVLLTLFVLAGSIAGTSAGRYAVAWTSGQAKLAIAQRLGLEADRTETDALMRVKRRREVEQTEQRLSRFYRGTSSAMRRLFDVAGMAPGEGLVRWGRVDTAFVVSSRVFERDDRGRSFRMRPNVRSVWLRQITLQNGPFSMFLVPDAPEVRTAAAAAGATVDEGSAQRTNSWGCRGPEPDPNATIRGIVLGDSFMQAMFNGEDQTPAVHLERYLRGAWGVPVSVLNTGHIGYAPEQYYFTLEEYGKRFRPQFIVVSVCPNDFGEYGPVLNGKGDGFEDAKYWLSKIVLWCRGRNVAFVLAPVPCEPQIEGVRAERDYPGRVDNIFEGTSNLYCNPLDRFINEHLRLTAPALRRGERGMDSPLYNGRIRDNHFSPAGAALWGETLGRRLASLVKPQRAATSMSTARAEIQ